MSDTFCHYAESAVVISDNRRQVYAGSGEVGGLELHWLGVGKENVLLTTPELQRLNGVLRGMDPAEHQRTRGHFLYRVVITKYPEGSWAHDVIDGVDHSWIDEDWVPDGWVPDEEWIARHGQRFFWPSTKFEYKSKSSARSRARLIESYGAETRVDQSSLITWPADDTEEMW